jgi:hypothetical protein
MRKRWWQNHKTLASDNWKRARDVVKWVVFDAPAYIRKSLRSENTQENLVPTVKHGRGSEMVWVFCWSHYYPSWPNHLKEVHGQFG